MVPGDDFESIRNQFNDCSTIMRIPTCIAFLVIFVSCSKSDDSASARILRTESTDYNGNVLYTEYGYDNDGRIISITEHENNDEHVVAVTITYSTGDVVLLSHPDADPVYNQTTEVHLTLDANGKMLKRVEYTHAVAKTPAVQPAEKFSDDTLQCAYDVTGLLNKTTESRYDSTRVDTTFYTTGTLTATTDYTTDAGNITSSDEYAVYPRSSNQGGIITASGGSSEYHNEFRFTKSFPNKTDFKNAAVLNEYALYYEPLLNISNKNMPDQVTRSTVDKDLNGSVIFTGTTTIDIERTYNTDGLMSSVSFLSQNTPYTMINYFYGK